MVSTVLDTFSYVKALETAGMPIKQAEVQAGLISKVFQDTISTQQTMREAESKIEIKLKEIEIKLKNLELKIEKVKGALNTQIAKWVLTTATAQTGILIFCIRFLH
ncbi:MAG: hypothetical protein V4471_03425 [Pseudomonadota bacterium]